MDRSDLIEAWLRYAPRFTASEAVFMAGIGLINDGDNAAYYSQAGLPALLRAAEEEVNGPVIVKEEYITPKRY